MPNDDRLTFIMDRDTILLETKNLTVIQCPRPKGTHYKIISRVRIGTDGEAEPAGIAIDSASAVDLFWTLSKSVGASAQMQSNKHAAKL